MNATSLMGGNNNAYMVFLSFNQKGKAFLIQHSLVLDTYLSLAFGLHSTDVGRLAYEFNSPVG